MNNKELIMDFIINELIEDESIALTETTSLFRNRVLDSLNLISLILFMEKSFNIKIDSSEVKFENMDTVANLGLFIDKKLNKDH